MIGDEKKERRKQSFWRWSVVWFAACLGGVSVPDRNGYCQSASPAATPIRLHPENPHYFLFRGQPTILITSGEHYGAVLNAEFDYVTYLNTLQAKGLNLTRIFNGTYYEQANSNPLVGDRNTLAPGP